MNELIKSIFQRNCWCVQRELFLDLGFISYDGQNFFFQSNNVYYEISFFEHNCNSDSSLYLLNIKEKIIKTEIKNNLHISTFKCESTKEKMIIEKHGIKKKCNISNAYGKFIYHNETGFPAYVKYDTSFNIYSVNWILNGVDFTPNVIDLYNSYEDFNMDVCSSEDFCELIRINLKI